MLRTSVPLIGALGAMDASSLIGKVVREVWTHGCGPVHQAWRSELTTPFATWVAYLELDGGQFICVSPCEVAIHEGNYPSLGLKLDPCNAGSMHRVLPTGEHLKANPLLEIKDFLPLWVASTEETDPLCEGAVSEIKLIGRNSEFVLFRHIMPPMTLGICAGKT